MWIIDKIKQRWLGKSVETRIALISEMGEGFYSWNGNLYESDIIRSCLRPFYKACGKLKAKQVRENGSGLKINPDAYVRVLLEEPNPYMTGQIFQERMAINYMLNNNAFAYIVRDDFGFAQEIYPLPSSGATTKYDEQGFLYIEFTLKNGKMLTIAYEDIIHLRQDYGRKDVFGSSNIKMLLPLMNIVQTTDTGIVQSIKNGALIRWLLKFKTALSPKDKTARAKEFAQAFLASDVNATGVAAVDTSCDAEQIKPNDNIPNAAQMDRSVARIYNIFGTNEKIVQSKYNEDEWNAYYESQIEPFSLQLANEMTRKIFSRRERAHGNSITYEASSLQYASMSTKLNLVQMVDRGSMTPNEWRRVMNLGPIEGGDVAIRRLDTAQVDEGLTKGGEKE